jgi:hypothetical protein
MRPRPPSDKAPQPRKRRAERKLRHRSRVLKLKALPKASRLVMTGRGWIGRRGAQSIMPRDARKMLRFFAKN